MIKHIIKLVWNRKKIISLLLIEIFLSFVVAFIACDMLISGIIDYSTPLGFDYHNVLDISIFNPHTPPFSKMDLETSAKYKLLLAEVKSLPQVRQASFILGNTPYGNMRINSSFTHDGITLSAGINYVGDEYLETMGLTMIEGRWFGPEDIGSLNIPFVIDETTREKMFGEKSAIGQKFQDSSSKKQLESETKYSNSVIGVVESVRPMGELQKARGEVFKRQSWDDSSYAPLGMMVKVEDGTNVAFEMELQRRLSSLAPDYNFRINPLSESRESKLRDGALAILIPLIIALFLLFNVMLGLFGIFWHSISRRRGEIGLRMVMGGSPGAIRMQLWGESLAIGSLAILAGIPIVVNLAVLGITKPAGTAVFFLSFICAAALLYLILTICVFYPSYLASRVRPAVALHNE